MPFLTPSPPPTPARAAAPYSPVHASYLVLFVLDGARPDYFTGLKLPHVAALQRAGTTFTGAFDGILESETPDAHTAISTGSTPRRNGILGFAWAQDGKELNLFDPAVVRAGQIERIMSNSHVPTIAGLFKARHRHELVVALSGHKYYAADPLGGPSADAIMYFRGNLDGSYDPTAIPGHVPPPGVLDAPGLVQRTQHLPDGMDDRLATRLALAAIRRMHPHVLLINYPEFDWPLGHVHGGNLDPAAVRSLMTAFDTDLGAIEAAYAQAHVLHRTLFVITSDHGMAPVTRWIPETVVQHAVQAAGTSILYEASSTGEYIWLHDPAKAQAVAHGMVQAADPGIQSVYYLSSSKQPQYVLAGGHLASPAVDAANRFLLATLMNGHEPGVVAFATRNASFAAARNGWKADHGGAGWHSQQIPLILSGPGIRSGMVSSPAQLIDIAPTVLADMRIRPAGMEGTVLSDALSAPERDDIAARRVEIEQLTPIVAALLQQDRYELSGR